MEEEGMFAHTVGKEFNCGTKRQCIRHGEGKKEQGGDEEEYEETEYEGGEEPGEEAEEEAGEEAETGKVAGTEWCPCQEICHLTLQNKGNGTAKPSHHSPARKIVIHKSAIPPGGVLIFVGDAARPFELEIQP